MITVLNNDDNPAQLSVPVPLSGAAGEAVNLLEEGPAIPIQDGKIQITIKGNWGAVLKITRRPKIKTAAALPGRSKTITVQGDF